MRRTVSSSANRVHVPIRGKVLNARPPSQFVAKDNTVVNHYTDYGVNGTQSSGAAVHRFDTEAGTGALKIVESYWYTESSDGACSVGSRGSSVRDFRIAMEDCQDGIALLDGSGACAATNPAFAALHPDYTAGELHFLPRGHSRLGGGV